ncbi:hypothetical protein QCN27_13270 [Cereibacter sp. SYSU M97828]|nr:hypothetical protein [Cereibacter flavus]
MTRTRNQRRSLKRNAGGNAALLAECCFDYRGSNLTPVSDPIAVDALKRAFTLMLKAGGEPMAVPIANMEASAFPRYKDHGLLLNGVTWLAVGLDVSGRATYAIQTAQDEDRTLAHDAARSMALSRLRSSLARAGFPSPSRKERGPEA